MWSKVLNHTLSVLYYNVYTHLVPIHIFNVLVLVYSISTLFAKTFLGHINSHLLQQCGAYHGRFIMQLQTTIAVSNRAVSAANIKVHFSMFQMSLSGKIQKGEKKSFKA